MERLTWTGLSEYLALIWAILQSIHTFYLVLHALKHIPHFEQFQFYEKSFIRLKILQINHEIEFSTPFLDLMSPCNILI